MKQIPLTKGYVALVDDADYEAVSKFKWYARIQRRTVYAERVAYAPDNKQTTIMLHRFILSITDPQIDVDHEDHNGLNNQRYNLRSTNASGNGGNAQKTSSLTSSRFKGIFWRKDRNKWRANIRVNRKLISLGCFSSEQEAALAYNKAAKELFGEFALLNQI